MILPLELIIYLDQYSTNHNILCLNKLINKEVKRSNNSEFWKSKYLIKTCELGIYKICLNPNDIISKYEYLRLIKQKDIVKYLYLITPHTPYNRSIKPSYSIDKTIILCGKKIKKYNKLGFIVPNSSFDINKFKIPKEFKQFDQSYLFV